MPNVTFMRHAETVYNANKIFAGRIDCELSKKGIQDTLDCITLDENNYNYYLNNKLKNDAYEIIR